MHVVDKQSHRWTHRLIAVLAVTLLAIFNLIGISAYRRFDALRRLARNERTYVYFMQNEPGNAHASGLSYRLYERYDGYSYIFGEGEQPTFCDLGWLAANYVQYSGMDVANVDLSPLRVLPQIKSLDLQESVNVESALRQLSSDTGIREFWLHASDVTDDVLVQLDPTSIEVLSIHETEVSADSLPFLESLTSLKTLFISEGMLTPAELNELTTSLPRVTVEVIPKRE
ncbi:MAG: hypothetical protein KDA86_09640 [Planctomycetaceae bacterium]|nr:hypothetical protein [Planctomycetaceae bacterium]